MIRLLTHLKSFLARRGYLVAGLNVLVAGFLVGMMFGWFPTGSQPRELSYSEFSRLLDDGSVAKVDVAGTSVKVELADGAEATMQMPGYVIQSTFLDRIVEKGAEVEVSRAVDGGGFGGILWSILPLVILLLIGGLILVQFDGLNRVQWPKTVKKVPHRFSDVAGQTESKAELEEIVTFLKNPAAFDRVGARAPRGVLMVGPPGTGKTLLAKALAGEAGVSFIAVSGSEFSASFVGVAKGRVARLFRSARKLAPAIVFIDEIDSLARRRGGGSTAVDKEFENTLNQLLTEMDGFENSEGVIVVAATNRVDVLDPALLRPGRFDRQVHVGLPDIGGRVEILRVHAAKVPLDPAVDLKIVARGTPGFSGADLANIVNEAAIFAAREERATLIPRDFEAARDKIMMGIERRSLALDGDEKNLIAVHEAGHALCACKLPASDAVHRATIIPHGAALGMVMRLPERDRLAVARERLEADLVVAMGGRAAEEVVLGPGFVTTGAESDIDYATKIATAMVTRWGMSPKIGMIRLHQEGQLPKVAEEEIRGIVENAYAKARAIVVEHRSALDALTAELLARETLEGDEVRAIVEGAVEVAVA